MALEKGTAKVEADLRRRDQKIKQLRHELRESRALIAEMRQRIKDAKTLIDSWIGAFKMQLDPDGLWRWDPSQAEFWKRFDRDLEDYRSLVANRNDAVMRPRKLGRPLAASEVQVKDVTARRSAGESLRTISVATGLSLRTVRTILSRDRLTEEENNRRRSPLKRDHDQLEIRFGRPVDPSRGPNRARGKVQE